MNNNRNNMTREALFLEDMIKSFSDELIHDINNSIFVKDKKELIIFDTDNVEEGKLDESIKNAPDENTRDYLCLLKACKGETWASMTTYNDENDNIKFKRFIIFYSSKEHTIDILENAEYIFNQYEYAVISICNFIHQLQIIHLLETTYNNIDVNNEFGKEKITQEALHLSTEYYESNKNKIDKRLRRIWMKYK